MAPPWAVDSIKLTLPPPIKLQAADDVFDIPPAIEDKVPVLVCKVPIVILQDIIVAKPISPSVKTWLLPAAPYILLEAPKAHELELSFNIKLNPSSSPSNRNLELA